MKIKEKLSKVVSLSAALFVLHTYPSSGFAQEFSEENPNFVRSSAILRANTDVIGPRIQPERFPTGRTGVSPVENGISFEDFQALVSTAFREGRGGVVDFESVIQGPILFDVDRTAVRAFIQQGLRTNPLRPGELLQVRMNELRQQAEREGIINDSLLRPVLARTDRSVDDVEDNIFAQDTIFDRLDIRYGSGSSESLVLTRGSQFKVEGIIGSRRFPGAETGQTINDSYFINIGTPGYSGGQVGRSSGTQLLHGGMLDFELDPRDNVTALGFILTNANNFQYWQGFGAPSNADNIIITVQFSDSSISVFNGTTDQANGVNDNFFGIQAPDGTSITRFWIRIIGRNFRTFVFLDDLGFVTSPTAPFIRSDRTLTGSVGQSFVYSLDIAKAPSQVTLAGLPSGLTFDPSTSVISGVFPANRGSAEVTVTMSNDVGTNVETLSLVWGDIAEPNLIPQVIELDSPLNFIIRQSLSRFPRIITNFDAFSDEELDELPGNVRVLDYFARVFRYDSSGNIVASEALLLESIGLSVADGQITGIPQSDELAGRYRVQIFVRNSLGGTMQEFDLLISPAVVGANFNDVPIADIAFFQGNVLRALLSSGNGDFSAAKDLLALSSDAQIFIADLNNDGRTEIIAFDRNSRDLDVFFVKDDLRTSRVSLLARVPSVWSIVAVTDIDGDGVADILWYNSNNRSYSLSKLSTFADESGATGVEAAWAGFIFSDGKVRDFVMPIKLGSNSNDGLLFRSPRGNGYIYQLIVVDSLPATGLAGTVVDEFFLESNDWEPVFTPDFQGSGVESLVWKNMNTGEFRYWNFTDGRVEDSLLSRSTEVSSPLGRSNVSWEIMRGVVPNNLTNPPTSLQFRNGFFVEEGTVLGTVSRRFNIGHRFEVDRSSGPDPLILRWGLTYKVQPGTEVSTGSALADLTVRREDGSVIENKVILADRDGIVHSFAAAEFVSGDPERSELQRLELRTEFHSHSFFTVDPFEPYIIPSPDENLFYRWALVDSASEGMEGVSPFARVPNGTPIPVPGLENQPIYSLIFYPVYRFSAGEEPQPVNFVDGVPIPVAITDIVTTRIDFEAGLGSSNLYYIFEQSQGVVFDPQSGFASGVAQDGATLSIAAIRESFRDSNLVTIQTETADVLAPGAGTIRGLIGSIPESTILFQLRNPSAPFPGTILRRFGSREIVASFDLNNDNRADLILRDRASGQFFVQLSTDDTPSYLNTEMAVFDGGRNWDLVHIADFTDDQINDLLLYNPTSGSLVVVSIASGSPELMPIDGAFSNSQFFGSTIINNDLTIPSGANTPVAPFTNALPLNPTPVGDDSDRWFFVENFGFLYHDGGDFIFTTQHGFWYIWSQSDVSDDIWAYDFGLGTWFWVNTFGQAYPWMFMLDPAAIIGDGWVFFFTNTRTPSRWFAVPVLEEFGFDPVIGESDLRDIINGAF